MSLLKIAPVAADRGVIMRSSDGKAAAESGAAIPPVEVVKPLFSPFRRRGSCYSVEITRGFSNKTTLSHSNPHLRLSSCVRCTQNENEPTYRG